MPKTCCKIKWFLHCFFQVWQIQHVVSISMSTVVSSGVYSKPLLCSLTLPCFPWEWSICPCLTYCWICPWNLFLQSSVDRMTKDYFWACLKKTCEFCQPSFSSSLFHKEPLILQHGSQSMTSVEKSQALPGL